MPDPASPCDITDPDPDGDFLPLAEQCAAEEWAACDDLFYATPVGSDWEEYGSTCGGRNDRQGGSCEQLYAGGGSTTPAPGSVPPATVPPTGLGSDPALDAQAQQCYDGDMAACDDLFFAADADSAYERYADTCAGRQPEGTGELCTATFPE